LFPVVKLLLPIYRIKIDQKLIYPFTPNYITRSFTHNLPGGRVFASRELGTHILPGGRVFASWELGTHILPGETGICFEGIRHPHFTQGTGICFEVSTTKAIICKIYFLSFFPLDICIYKGMGICFEVGKKKGI
jgi:hypothetical protein